MKFYTKTLVVFLIIGILSLNSCDKDFGDINNSFETNLKDPTTSGLFNGLVASLKKGGTRNRVPVAWLYQWNQQAAMYALSGFRLDKYVTSAWSNYYTALANYHDIENLITKEEKPANFTNIQAMMKIIMAYKALTTTLLYGDIPYTEAGKGFLSAQAFRPAYDSQQYVMETAINDLTWAIENLSISDTQESLRDDSDTLLDNDIDMWIKFANSLRFRYAMIMRDKNPTFSDSIIDSSLKLPLLSPSEHISLDPKNISGLGNNREEYYRGNSYVRMGSTMWEAMSSTNDVDGSGIYDLRCNILFEPNEDDEWIPYPQNPSNTTPIVTGNPHIKERLSNWDSSRSNFATFNVYYIQDHSIPQFIVTGSQISFLKAEIYNRGIVVVADPIIAEKHYNEAITTSVNFWYNHAFNSIWDVNKPDAAVPTETQMNGMLNNSNVKYSTDEATALNQIYKQSWISLFHQPFEAWNLQRRTNNATPNIPLVKTSLVYDFNKLVYPPSERETNRVNWKVATDGGNDSETKKIWIQQ